MKLELRSVMDSPIENTFKQNTEEILKSDPLYIAEKITGKDYQSDQNTVMLGMALQMGKSRIVAERLTQNCDVHFRMKLPEYIKAFEEMGFKKIYSEPFMRKDLHSGEEFQNTFNCYWHDEYSVLLSFDTFTFSKNIPESLNGGDVYFNWKPYDKKHCYFVPASGCWKETKNGLVHIGYFDCREAVRFYLEKMRDEGTFIKPWIQVPFSWLTHNAEHDSKKGHRFDLYYHKTIERMKQFPQYVQDIIGEYKP